jgi:CubicO group peptidase (beta-lactamase class C family)
MHANSHVDPRFETAAALFDTVIAEAPIGGAALAVYVDGECVLDLHGGESRPGVIWTADTLNVMYSCTKGLIAAAVGTFIERGVLDPDAPVVRYWPEFARISDSLTVRGMFEHRAGLSATRRDLSLDEALDHDTLIATLLDQEPLWEPGTGYAYHALTFGTLVDDLVRRVDGRTVSELFRDVFAAPLGVDAWIGLPASEEHRVAEFVTERQPEPQPIEPGSTLDWMVRSMTFGTAFPAFAPIEPNSGFNSARVHQAQLPGANGITSARGLAAMWSAVVTDTNGVRIVTDDTIALLTERRISGPSVWGEKGPWTDRGFGVMIDTPSRIPLLSPTSFGHDGYGGQAGWADVTHRASFAFLTNNLVFGSREHDRWRGIIAEVRRVLEQ